MANKFGSYEYQRYPEEYFSGCDVRIFFGDIFVDEIVTLDLTIAERVEPIYGYASFVADAFARGNRLIQGTFSINFREAFYLKSILNKLSNANPSSTARPFASYSDDWHKPRTADEVLTQIGENYREMAEKFQKAIWGESESSNVSKPTDSFFYRQNQSNLLRNGFNILISYGNSNKDKKEIEPLTANSIIGVQLNGQAKSIKGTDGTPIREVYSFMAKDIDGDISRIHE